MFSMFYASSRRVQQLTEHEARCNAKPGQKMDINKDKDKDKMIKRARRAVNRLNVESVSATESSITASDSTEPELNDSDLAGGGLFNCEACAFATNNGAMFTSHVQGEAHKIRTGSQGASDKVASQAAAETATNSGSVVSNAKRQRSKRRGRWFPCPDCPFVGDRLKGFDRHWKHKHGGNNTSAAMAKSTPANLMGSEATEVAGKKTAVSKASDVSATKKTVKRIAIKKATAVVSKAVSSPVIVEIRKTSVVTAGKEVEIMASSKKVEVMTASKKVEVVAVSKGGEVMTVSKKVEVMAASKEVEVMAVSKEVEVVTASFAAEAVIKTTMPSLNRKSETTTEVSSTPRRGEPEKQPIDDSDTKDELSRYRYSLPICWTFLIM